MRSQRNEGENPAATREKSRAAQRRPKAEKSEENTIEKLSTQLDSEQPAEPPKEKRESGGDVHSSPKKKAKFNSPLGPDQLKRDINKRLDSNMEWIMKRITKEQNTPAEGKNKIKLFFNKSVYEVETQTNEPKKPDHGMKKVYKELKESFNLLYSPDLIDQENRLRKINGLNFYNEAFVPPEENCKSVRGNKRHDQGALSLACKREFRSPKQSSLMDNKKAWPINQTPKAGDGKPSEGILSKQVSKAKTAIKTSKTVIEGIKKPTEPLANQDSASKAKATHQKAHSNLEKRLEKSCMISDTKTLAPKKSERRMTNIVPSDSIIKKRAAIQDDPHHEENLQKHIPSIHRSFSSYYMRHFQRNGIKLNPEKKTYDMHEADQGEELEPLKELSTERKKSRSQSRKMDKTLNSISLVAASSNSIDSFYKLIFELDSCRQRPLGTSVTTFIGDMIKTMQDFTNRFPHGAPPPERSVNLPGKNKPSSLLLP